MYCCGNSFYRYMNNPFMGGCFPNSNPLFDFMKFNMLSNMMSSMFAMPQQQMFMPQFVMPQPIMPQVYPVQSIFAQTYRIPQMPSLFNFQQPAYNNTFSININRTKTPKTEVSKTPVAKGKVLSKTEYVKIACDAAKKYGVDEKLVLAVIDQESKFENNLTSPAGAQGLMQLMPSTSKWLGVTNPMDPKQNIDGGVRLLKQLLDKYNGNVAQALAAYNWGTGNVDKYLAGKKSMPAETRDYIKIADTYQNYSVA